MSTSGPFVVEEGSTPRIFLCPGIYGDDRRLAQFRRFCAPTLDLVLVDLPPPHAAAHLLGSVARTGAFVGSLIDGLQPAGRVRLAGYSFGGNVAFEATHHLIRQGRSVSLALIDAYLSDPHAADPAPRGAIRRLLWWVFDHLCLWDRGRRLVLDLVERAWPAKRPGFGRRTLWSLRRRSIVAWRPRPLGLPVLLVASEPFAAGLSLWREVALDARIVSLPCDHWEILKPPAAVTLRDALVAHFIRTDLGP